MMEKYVVRTDRGLSKPMSREEAVSQVKNYAGQGVEAFIVSEDEAARLKNSEWHPPKWT